MNKEKCCHLAKIYHRFIDENDSVISMDLGRVHVREKWFLESFKDYEMVNYSKEYNMLSTTHNGIKFMCLSKKTKMLDSINIYRAGQKAYSADVAHKGKQYRVSTVDSYNGWVLWVFSTDLTKFTTDNSEVLQHIDIHNELYREEMPESEARERHYYVATHLGEFI